MIFYDPIPPEEFARRREKEEKKRAKTHTTVRGRVVYSRRRHYFSMQDVKRILRNLLQEDRGVPTREIEFIRDWGEVALMVFALAAERGGIFGISPLFSYVEDLVKSLIQGKIEIPKNNKEAI